MATATKSKKAADGPEQFGFQAEVSKLLDIVAHSLYSEKEVFLRELISNASDACDKLRYAALTQPKLLEDETGDGAGFAIRLSPDKKANTLTVADNGIGMNREDLIENLGTIARSGTAAFLEQLAETASKKEKKDVNLIGQFGVGFYSAFMVAERVEVLTRRAGEEKAWKWASDGQGEFTIEPAEKDIRGTEITLHLKKEAKDFTDPTRLRHVVKTYSDHIAVPIRLDEGKEDADTLNEASALWTRAKNQIKPEQYTEFYRHVGHAFDEPWLTMHWKAEGKIEYTSLLFIPTSRPFDLFHPERKPRVKLYVKRVFITEDSEDVLPGWLRFVRGIVDSEDLPLNISREMLQNNPVLAKIRQGLIKRVLSELKKKAEKAPEEFAAFWENFGPVLKEGLYEAPEHRDAILELARFHSTADAETAITLADYVGRMKDGQDAIFYIAGEDAAALAKSPQIEGFRKKGVEVLLLEDSVDEFWVPAAGEFDGKPFKSVTHGGADLSEIKGDAKDETKKKPAKNIGTLVAVLKDVLGEAVADVRESDRLTDSPVCLVASDGALDMHLERILKAHGQLEQVSARVLEINPDHPLIKKLAKEAGGDKAGAKLADAAHLLLDQARILEGETLPDSAAFARRMAAVMERGLG